MFVIRDASGRVLGSIDPTPETADTLRRVIALASRMRRENSRPLPAAPPERRRPEPVRPRRVGAARGVLYSLAGVAVFGLACNVAGCGEPIPASVAAPVVTAPAPEVSTGAHPVGGVNVAPNGDVLESGTVVDNVYSATSPVRADYLGTFSAAGVPVGSQDRTIREGVQFCADVAAGRTVAMRELFDARTDLPQFGTGDRRRVVALAAVENLCTRYR